MCAARAIAADYPPITRRDFTLDLYTGAVLGASRIIGMGGTSIALAEGSAYTLQNVAAPAVRPATSNGTWDWDWHFDWLNPSLSSDYDNNGDPTASVGQTLMITGGLVGQYQQWALALTLTVLDDTFTAQGASQTARVELDFWKLVLARSFLNGELTFGLGIKTGSFSITDLQTNQRLFGLGGGSLEAGAVWRPLRRSMRAGFTLSFPVTGTEPSVVGCDPSACHGYILPDRVVVPWELGAGFAYRFGPTPWNEQVHTPWRDERQLTLAADLIVQGPVANAFGLEEFILQRLQRSGKNASVSLRLGAEYEWIPGWLRVRAGSYWEPGRFEDVSGRLHATFGIEGRVLAFSLWGSPYRIKLGLTADLASAYENGALSIGFW